MFMLIELKEEIELSGKVYYKLYVDGFCEEVRHDHGEAVALFNTFKERAAIGFPKTTLLQTFNTK